MKNRVLDRVRDIVGLKPRHSWHDDYEKALADYPPDAGSHRADLEQSLLDNDHSLIRFAGKFTVPESFFLRHNEHFDYLAEYAEQRLLSHANERLKIWSAGCANGEEPYSAAITLTEHLEQHHLSRIDIYATDVNPEAIERANARSYTSWAFRGVPDYIVYRYFDLQQNKRCQLLPEIADMVQFEVATLQKRMLDFPAASIDIIFFRNVGIYLTEDTLHELFKGFSRILKGEGCLFVAPSDPRPQTDLFTSASLATGSIFKKKNLFPAVSFSDWTLQSHANSDRKPLPIPQPKQPTIATLDNRSVVALLPGKPTAQVQAVPTALPDRREAHQDVFDRDAALLHAQQLIDIFPEDAGGWILRGRLYLEKGEQQKAVADLRRAVYVDASDRLARFWYASALNEGGQRDEAQRQLQYLHNLLGSESPETLLEDQDTLAGELQGHVEFLISEWA